MHGCKIRKPHRRIVKSRRASGFQLSFDLAEPDVEEKADSADNAPSFSPAPPKSKSSEPEVFSVAALTRRIKSILEKGIGLVWVTGEISNYRRQSSGHHYFTIKDDAAQLACVLFAGDARLLRDLKLADGMAVRLSGELTVYERRGNYQLVVRLVQLEGEGALQARFEALKRMLDAEGLFAAERKRELPRFPRRVGVVTSPTGAALRDFLQILWRRNPQIEVVLSPARVQGTGAAREIAAALADLASLPVGQRPDVVVLTRGGGSIEDLWEFNEEVLARAIAASPLPVISAVGHEIDFTIADFVADQRAPTPSAAAELLSAEAAAIRGQLVQASRQMNRLCSQEIRTCRLHLDRALVSFRKPGRHLREFVFELDRMSQLLKERTLGRVERMSSSIERARATLRQHHPARHLRQTARELTGLARRQAAATQRNFRHKAETLRAHEKVLRAFDPGHTLQRGFTLTFDQKGKLLKSAVLAQNADSLLTRFADGEVRSKPAKG
jgi:exodeoxyribonuclease VII large subunit